MGNHKVRFDGIKTLFMPASKLGTLAKKEHPTNVGCSFLSAKSAAGLHDLRVMRPASVACWATLASAAGGGYSEQSVGAAVEKAKEQRGYAPDGFFGYRKRREAITRRS